MSLPASPARPSRRGLLGLAGLALIPAPPAAAHAIVVASDPTAGAALATPPRRVTIRFNSRIDHGRSRLVLVGPDGVQVPLDLDLGTEPVVIEAAVAGSLAPGAWRLRWQVLAIDGHITRGDIPFTLQAP